ncbi:MAG: protein-disulfide reductase DsbD [Gammaproteobacteria bacterium]
MNEAMRKLSILILLCCLMWGVSSAVFAGDEPELLEPEAAFELNAAAKYAETLTLSWAIADGYYLYRHKFNFASQTAGIELGVPQFPKGEGKRDKFFGHVEIYRDNVIVELPLRRLDAKAKRLAIDLSYQGCAEARVCYLPIRKTITLELPEMENAAAGITVPASGQSPGDAEPERIAAGLSAHSLGLTLASFFGFGLLLAFTPCVFPMIPIISGIVVGDGAEPSMRRAFALSLCYVLASALTYTVFGVLAGLFGQNLQAFFQQSWILIGTSGLFVLLALSMFGLFTLQMPACIQSRLASLSSRQRHGNWLGAIIMGMLSALTISPCVTAPLAGALIYIGQSGDALLGGLALFALGLGMGLPLLVIGTSAGEWLPRAGAWLHVTKTIFGVGLLAVSVWLLGRILPASAMLPLWGVLLSVPLLYLGWKKLWKVTGFIALIYTVLLLAGIMTQPQRDYLEFLCTAAVACHAEPLPFQKVETAAEFQQRLAEAEQKGQWLMLDFHADWCVTCLEMQNTTFADPRVRSALSALALVQADVTEEGAAARVLLSRFELIGPPAILFFGPDQRERKSFRIIGYMDSEAFLAQIKRLAG